tara:strand:- start:899 stop:1324 length:426 start_codon:yes stop_codon:yes gene_type:complete
METHTPLSFDMIQSGNLQMNKKTWLSNLSDSQYDCVVNTLEQIETSTKGRFYNIHTFPDSFMISFTKEFYRKDWLNQLSNAQYEHVSAKLETEQMEICRNAFCCECCNSCNGTGKIKYGLHNFPFDWIKIFELDFMTKNIQ